MAKVKKIQKLRVKLKAVGRFMLNPRLLVCLGGGWMITNGWSYVLLGLGTYFQNEIALAVAGAYLAFLWLPISPEKIVTVILALYFLRKFFPHDEHTLKVLEDFRQKFKGKKTKKPRNKFGLVE